MFAQISRDKFWEIPRIGLVEALAYSRTHGPRHTICSGMGLDEITAAGHRRAKCSACYKY